MTDNNKPVLIILIGLPAAGKTSFVKRIEELGFKKDFKIFSTDDLIDSWAKNEGVTYNTMFHHAIDHATKLTFEAYQQALLAGENIIFDQTSLTKKSRAKKLSYPGVDKYRKVAIVFDLPSTPTEWKEYRDRVNSRNGKQISAAVIDTMSQNFEFPNHEGFDDILTYKHPSEVDSLEKWDIGFIMYGPLPG